MSHTMNIQALLTDGDAIRAACEQLGYEFLGHGTYDLYETTEEGIGIRMPGMNYAVVVKTDGTVAFDDYDWQGVSGQTGSRFHESIMWPLIDAYGIEWSKAEARKQGLEAMESFNQETNEVELRIMV